MLNFGSPAPPGKKLRFGTPEPVSRSLFGSPGKESREEEKYEEGLYRVSPPPLTLDEVVSVRPEHKCMNKDGQYIRLNISTLNKQAFLDSNPLLYERPTNPGVYTYLVYSNDDVTQEFVCCKTQSVYELGTLHMSLVYRVGAKLIHAAGEIQVTNGGGGKRTEVNFLSGTYMGTYFRSLGPKSRITADSMYDLLHTKMREKLGDDIVFGNETFIPKDRPVTDQDIAAFQAYGGTVTYFPSKEECDKSGGRRKSRRRKSKKRYSVRTKRAKRQ